MKLTFLLKWCLVFVMAFGLLTQSFAKEEKLWYLGYRVPSTDQDWTADDYALMLKTLQKIKAENPDALPRRGGEFTGDLYNRMIAHDNFRPQLSIYTPIVLRREEAFAILQYLKEIMKLYFDFKAKKQVYGAEALGLMAFSIRQQAVLFTVNVEFWMSLSPKDQKNPERVQGLLSSKAAAAALTMSALDYLTFNKQFDENELIVYAYELSDTIPDLFVHLRSQDKKAIKEKVAKLQSEQTNKDIRDALDRLMQMLAAIPG